MFQFVAFEKNAGAVARRDGLQVIVVVDAQFAAVLFLPAGIEVHDHGKRPAFVVAELVEVFFIKTAFFVQRIMEFVAGNAGVAAAVEVTDKLVHQFEKMVFVQVVVQGIEPVNLVAPDAFVVLEQRIVSDAGREHLTVRIQFIEIFPEMSGQRNTQKVFGDADLSGDVTVD